VSPGDEVRRAGLEEDVPAARRDPRGLASAEVPPVETLTSAVVPSCRSRTNTSRLEFASFAARFVARCGRRRSAVGRDRPVGAVVVPLRAVAREAHALGRAELPVADEDVPRVVRVARHEGRGEALEDDEASSEVIEGSFERSFACARALETETRSVVPRPGRGRRRPSGGSSRSDEVRRRGEERDEASVG
jgi:hypothetical protein